MWRRQGYNAAIIAYGQTGTGKTFTMEGGSSGASRGIIPRAIEDVFATIGSDAVPNSKFLVRASYLQIYNEVRVPADEVCRAGFAETQTLTVFAGLLLCRLSNVCHSLCLLQVLSPSGF